MTKRRHVIGSVRLNRMRSAHATDAPASLLLVIGLIWLLGLWRFVAALLPAAAIYALPPIALQPLIRRYLGSDARPIRAVLLRAAVAHGSHVLGITWLLMYAIAAGGVAPVARLLGACVLVYEVPRHLLPLTVGRRAKAAVRTMRHVLLQRSQVIGDLVLATPCIEAIKRSSPGCRVSVLCRESTSELLLGHESVEAVIADPTVAGHQLAGGSRRSQMMTLVRALRDREIDALISLWDRPSSVYPMAALLARIPIRSGNACDWGGWMLNAGVLGPHSGALHEVEYNLQRVRALGFDLGRATPRLSIALQPEDIARAGAMLAERSVRADEFLVALSPATSGANRRLEPDTYARFVQRIRASHGARTLLLAGTTDRDLTAAILAGSPDGTLDFAGETSVGLLAALIARCQVHVGGDSGPTHIAAALGVKSVVISPAKSQKPLRWGPWMVPHRIVRSRPGCRLQCVARTCPISLCVSAITVDDVCEAFHCVVRGDGVLEPLNGRRYWAALSLSVLVHAPFEAQADEAMATLRLLRQGGFIEIVLGCRRGSALADQAAAEGVDVRGCDTASLFDAIIELTGGVVYDFGTVPTPGLRRAMWLARRVGSETCRIGASWTIADDAGALTDRLLAELGARGRNAVRI